MPEHISTEEHFEEEIHDKEDDINEDQPDSELENGSELYDEDLDDEYEEQEQEQEDEDLEDEDEEDEEDDEEDKQIDEVTSYDEETDVSPASVEPIQVNEDVLITESHERSVAVPTAFADDSAAAVVVDIEESDKVVGMMIDNITSKFPPETVVTVSSGVVHEGHFVEGHSIPAYHAIDQSRGHLSTSTEGVYTTSVPSYPVTEVRSVGGGSQVNVHTSVMPNGGLTREQYTQKVSQQQSQITEQIRSSDVRSAVSSKSLGGNIYMSVSGGTGQIYETTNRYEDSSVIQGGSVIQSGAYETSRVQSSASFGEQSVVSQRVVSSTVLHEESSKAQEDSVTYIEVPVVEYKDVFVPKKQIVEVEKFVPRIETEWVERIVEVPQIQYVDKTVEIPRYEEVIRHVPRKEIVDVPREFITHVPKIETKIVEKIIEVPQIIERNVPQIVEQKVEVARYTDKEVATVVAQTINSVVKESGTTHAVDAHKYEPRLVAVDVFVPLPVSVGEFVGIQKLREIHQLVDVPAAHYNSLVKELNTHIEVREHQQCLPLVQELSGHIPFLPIGEKIDIVNPVSMEWQSAYSSNKIYCQNMTSHKVINLTSEVKRVGSIQNRGFTSDNRVGSIQNHHFSSTKLVL